ncbi:IS1096 element passenger TnpR family protein [Pseudonocardia tropica]
MVQEAMGWTNSHLHEFEIDRTRYGFRDPDVDTGIPDGARTKLF